MDEKDTAKLRWSRAFPNSSNNFNLTLQNPESLDRECVERLLEAIRKVKHRGLSLSGRATAEFSRWLNRPGFPLKSAAFVLLSNWFMTQSGDRNSEVALRCEALWDYLFATRPHSRLSSPQPGRNHQVLPESFDEFFDALQVAQGEQPESNSDTADTQDRKSFTSLNKGKGQTTTPSNSGQELRAIFSQGDLQVELTGSPEAIAEFFFILKGSAE